MKALTVCQPYPSLADLAFDGFGHWLAGFSDGEACFYISAGNGSHRCQFRIKLRRDDRDILDSCATRTGCGYVKDLGGRSASPMSEWMVVRKADCARVVELFAAFPLRAKKARDFEIWREAVAVSSLVRRVVDGRVLRRGGGSSRDPRQEHLARLKAQLSDVRRSK